MVVVIPMMMAIGLGIAWTFPGFREQVSWWIAVLGIAICLYWPIDRARTQINARTNSPLCFGPARDEIRLRGERVAKKSVEAVEEVKVHYGDKGGEFEAIAYHEIHLIVRDESGRRRVVIVEEAGNPAGIAADIAGRIGCPVREVRVRGPEA